MKTNKKDILVIGGGLTFSGEEQMLSWYRDFDIDHKNTGKSWKDWLSWSLEDKFNFINLKFPTKDNANYKVWKIIFEKYFSKIQSKNIHIVAHSLGTIFILKYLTENKFKYNIDQLHLVSPIVSNSFQAKGCSEDTGTFTFELSKLNNLQNICKQIHIWHSVDDELCSFDNAKYLKKVWPSGTLHKFTNRGHFIQSTFFELFDMLRVDKY